MYQVARAGLVDPVLRIVEPVRVRHRIKMVQIAEEFVEAVHRRQVFVQIAQMVLAELPGLVALRLQDGCQRHRLVRQADIRARLAHRGQPRAQRQFAGDEVRPPGGATRLGVVVREHHPLGRKPVQVRRPAGHHAAMIRADIEPAHVVAHDHENVGLAHGRLGLGRRCRNRGGRQQRTHRQNPNNPAPQLSCHSNSPQCSDETRTTPNRRRLRSFTILPDHTATNESVTLINARAIAQIGPSHSVTIG